ncbi:DUF1345 domain-containing protein [Nakamurella endophytica]|uniref:Membrane protein n=1 Tax=Nakamurella endophytica TaxID=1748367 RepID=A0A917TBP6_9ACTN|nr:DUF1345 domain-containing protein [Nakamurella endophytica]GGM16397.1 membrane protein [Nakamurella endophytica]
MATPSAPVLAVASRAVELALVALGVLFTFVVEDEHSSLEVLLWWVLLAMVYLVAGGIRLRRSRIRPTGAVGAPGGLSGHRLRFTFLFAMISSLTGLTTAFDIALSSSQTDTEQALEALGGVAMILSWLLLHSGYARRYAQLFDRGGGLRFPQPDAEAHPAGTVLPRPTSVDFLYFAFSIGATFSTSDVQVVQSRMRWHVLVHSVLSFFYNAAVVAYAITVLREV